MPVSGPIEPPSSTDQKLETPGIKEVAVLSVNNPENYEDGTNQTGLSHHEMKIIDSFYSVPDRPRSKAYNEARQAARQKKSAKKEARESRRYAKKNNMPQNYEPHSIEFAMENTKKLGILNLSKMNLSDIPDLVFESIAGTARFINLSNNQLCELDTRFCDYVLVQRLTANGNLLNSIPTSISRMTALKKLDLANNQLKSLPDSFASMKYLEHVDLSENQLTLLPPSFTCLNLTDLKLNHNQFEIFPSQISTMEWLLDLDLSFNRITTIPDDMASLPRLISFNLDHNDILDFPNSILHSCTALVTLRLRGNPMTLNSLQEKAAFDQFDARRKLKLKRQLDAGTVLEADLIPADS